MTEREAGTFDGSPLRDAAWRREFRRRLLAWYRRGARDLPWRNTRDPYAIWVSEVMLQQTQVATVQAYYARFLRELPDLRSLAAADERTVLRLWEGLGYYRRARQLHRAAQVVVQDHQGQLPQDAEALRSLPGIGRYTAGAILSIAFEAREPILEANTIRLLTRLLAYDQDPSRSQGQRLLWSFAEQLLPVKKNIGTVNQALMELGSEICTPQAPDCDRCPVARLCASRTHGCQDRIPIRKAPVRYENVREVAVVIRRRSRVLLRRCAAGERWEGLWDFPRFALPSQNGTNHEAEIARHTRDITGLTIQTERRLTTIRHGVTRYRITLDCYEASVVAGRSYRSRAGLRWVPPTELGDYPLSVTGRRISLLLVSAARAGNGCPRGSRGARRRGPILHRRNG